MIIGIIALIVAGKEKMIKVAVVGCGRIAEKHINLLTGGQIKGAELVAVCDIVPERASIYGAACDVPWFVYIDRMVKEVEPDLISILTPSGCHVSHVLKLAPYGIPMLVEKPLALTLKEIDVIEEACKSYSVRVGEVKQNRYNVAVQHLKGALDAGKLGTPHMASVRVWWRREADYYSDWHGTWEQAGGVLANQAIHHVDLLQWLMGPVKQVSAFATYNDYTKVETGIVASLEFGSGAIGTIQATTLAQPRDLEGSLAILGDGGTVELGGFAVNAVRKWELKDDVEKQSDNEIAVWKGSAWLALEKENPPDVYGFGHLKMYEDVVRCLREDREFPVPPREARKALEIVHACYHSMEIGEIICLKNRVNYFKSRLGR